jgi:hypothetical protein
MLTYGIHLASAETRRSGIIPYTFDGSSVHFLLARDSATRELGDFGGGVKKHEFSLNGGFREFTEESNGIFSNYYSSPNELLDKLAVLDGEKMAVIFIPIDSKWLEKGKAQKTFEDSKKTSKRRISDEISEFIWISEKEFIDLILSPSKFRTIKLWKMVRSFFLKLKNVQDIPTILKSMYTI